jgi:hopanoid C-3 methylase
MLTAFLVITFLGNMKLLAVHPSCLMYSKIYLRLEPLGLELVAAACRRAGYDVRVIDLQVENHRDYFRLPSGPADR